MDSPSQNIVLIALDAKLPGARGSQVRSQRRGVRNTVRRVKFVRSNSWRIWEGSVGGKFVLLDTIGAGMGKGAKGLYSDSFVNAPPYMKATQHRAPRL